MPRARNIKPAFFANDIIAGLEPLTRLLLIGIWTIADKAGRLEDRPRRIRAEVLPYDDCDVEPMLAALAGTGLIERYEANGTRAIQVVNWDKDQNPHCKEPQSTIPAPCSSDAEPDEAWGEAPESTEPAGLIPDSGSLISDSESLISDSKKTPRKRVSTGFEISVPNDVDKQTWNDWVRLRRSKRAPVTPTVVLGVRAEAEKAGVSLQRFLEIWCVRGSQGLQAEWIRPENHPAAKAGAPRESFAERDDRMARERWAEASGRYVPEGGVIDVPPAALIAGES